MTGGRRGVPARLGVSALNLLAPGLGLLRVGLGKAALVCLAMPWILVAMPVLLIGVTRITAPALFLATILLTVAGIIGCYVWTIVSTWRTSRLVIEPRPWWARWYGLVIAMALSIIAGQGAALMARQSYHSYRAVSGSMLPTFMIGDQFWVNMSAARPPHVGEPVLLTTGDRSRIYRIVAMGGDWVGIRGGIPVVNGVAASQRLAGTFALNESGSHSTARRFVERLPGEVGTHYVLDDGFSEGDDRAETIVPTHDIFVLGDNRDNSADSRFSADLQGVGMVPTTAILGTPIVYMWSRDRSRIGRAPL